MDLDDQFDLRNITAKDEDQIVSGRMAVFLSTFGVEAPVHAWMAVQGAVMLALRHPQFNGPSRDLAEAWAAEMSAKFVEIGALTPEEVEDMWRSEGAITEGLRADHEGQPLIIATGEIVCIRCGCTDRKACPNRCHWVQVDRAAGVGVCSNCA